MLIRSIEELKNESFYRSELDGVRAIAVLTVLFYHVGFNWSGGGFIGVDVFFVISGYLITRLILNQKTRGTFTYGNFYMRRLRRLAPAYVFTLLVVFVLGVMLFTVYLFKSYYMIIN